MNLNYDLSLQQLQALPEHTYLLLDIRDEDAWQHGSIQGAQNLDLTPYLTEDAMTAAAGLSCSAGSDSAPDPACDALQQLTTQLDALLPKGRTAQKLVLFCHHGQISRMGAELLCDLGYDACSLTGGYDAWLLQSFQETRSAENERRLQIEKSIRQKFHAELFSRFAKAVKTYELIKPNDRIAVCISGGKDSMLMAKLFQELQRQHVVPFELLYLVMDPGYNETNRLVIENNARLMGIPITVFETEIFNAVDSAEKNPCYLCARMRRGYLYKKAKELGCNKIALGHHYDDVIETILMGMLYSGQIQTMMPKLHSNNFPGMELIRPMYLIREDDIKHWRDYNDLHFIQCACHFTDTCTTCRSDGSSVSKRMETKNLIRQLRQSNRFLEGNIFKSVENVNLHTIIAYKENGQIHRFLDHYDDETD